MRHIARRTAHTASLLTRSRVRSGNIRLGYTAVASAGASANASALFQTTSILHMQQQQQRRTMAIPSITSSSFSRKPADESDPFIKLARHSIEVHNAIDQIRDILSAERHAHPEMWSDYAAWPNSSFQKQQRITLFNRKLPLDIHSVPEYVNIALRVLLSARIGERDTQRQGFRVLVLVPTREHAILIERHFNAVLAAIREQTDIMKQEGVEDHNLYEFDGVEVLTTIGGHSYEREVHTMDFSEPEIVIATPGRLTKHIDNSDYFRNLKFFVVDECDLFFNSSSTDAFKKNNFERQLTKICSNLSGDRMTVCVSNGKELSAEDVPLSILLKSMEDAAKESSEEGEEEGEGDEAGAQDEVPSEGVLQILLADPDAVKTPVKRAVAIHADDTAAFDSLAEFLRTNLHRKITIFAQNSTVTRTILEELKNRKIYCSHVDHKTAQSIREAVIHSVNESKNGILICTESFAGVLGPDTDIAIHMQTSDDAKVTKDNVEYRERCVRAAESSLSLLVATGENPLPEEFSAQHSA